ncbi:MAG: MBL fold metallo-hydrolase [Clostridiales bacterium]|nr:MBL fold metallo-hydrolase [Clostridiales bacterium]
MKITYLSNSGFVIELSRSVLIFDYYRDTPQNDGKTIIRRSSDKVVYFFVSHRHMDHFNPTILTFDCEARYIISNDVEINTDRNVIFIGKGDSWSDGAISVKAFGSTDEGVSFVVQSEGLTIFHAGDLNNWHWNEEVPAHEAQKYETDFLNELNVIKNEYARFDAAMFPVDPRLGKDYARGAEQFVDMFDVGLFVPMHFGAKYSKAAAVENIAKSGIFGFFNISAQGDCIDWAP